MKIISNSINLEKLESARFTTKQGTKCLLIPLEQKGLYVGEKGVYLNTQTAINDEKDDYGNDSATWISQSKEEREAEEKKTYLGNGKVVFDSGNRNPDEAEPKPQAAKSDTTEEEDDLPF